MVQMKTIKQVFEALKASDPDTAITAYALRRMVKEGKIPSQKSGNKYLIDLLTIEKYLMVPYKRDGQGEEEAG